MSEVLYPWGYGKLLVPEERLWQLARIDDLMEPGMARRVKAYIRSKGGAMGIGGAVRFVQPDKPGFAKPGSSFHEMQTWSDGVKNFAALDLVMTNGGDVHRSPTWAEVPQQGSKNPDISAFGVHANVPGEPWHLQVIEIDSWTGWVNAGRKRPNPNYPIKEGTPIPQPIPDPSDIPPGSRVLKLTSPTMKGSDVSYVQQTLKNQGRTITVDGDYGAKTTEHVKWYQAKENLSADGIVGPKTWAALINDNLPAPPPPGDSNVPGTRTLKLTSPTMTGADVRYVQNVLNDQGLTLSVDGVYGMKTRDKVKVMQGWNELTQDGVVGPETWAQIMEY